MFVIKEARRRGVFRSLYNHVHQQAKLDSFVKCVRLYCETENLKAQAVYEALGMEKMTGYCFEENDFVFGH